MTRTNDKASEARICPVCGREYSGYPALSRRDNKTEICPACGVAEALSAWATGYRKEKASD